MYHVILNVLKQIFQEIQKKSQYFHTYQGYDLKVLGVSAIASQIYRVNAWDFHKSHVHDVNYVPCEFDSLGKKYFRRYKRKINIFIHKDMTLWKVLPPLLYNNMELMHGAFINLMYMM